MEVVAQVGAVPSEERLWANNGVQNLCAGLAMIAYENSPVLGRMEDWVFASDPAQADMIDGESVRLALQEASDFSWEMLGVAKRRGDDVASAFAQAAHHECKTRRTGVEYLKVVEGMALEMAHMYAAPAVWGATEQMHNWRDLTWLPVEGDVTSPVEPADVQELLEVLTPSWKRLGLEVDFNEGHGEVENYTDTSRNTNLDELRIGHARRILNHLAKNARDHDRSRLSVRHDVSGRKVTFRDQLKPEEDFPVEEARNRVARDRGQVLLGRQICGPDWKHQDLMLNQGLGVGLSNAQKHAKVIGGKLEYWIEEKEKGAEEEVYFVTELAY